MTRKINAEGEALIKSWEALKLKAYKDTGGVWTIGWGHTGPEVHKGLTITEDEAEALFTKDIAWAQDAVEQNVKVPLTDNQFAALVSFTYNVGASAFKTSTLLKKLNAGQYDAVPTEMRKWIYDNKKVVQGLVNRRNAEIGLWTEADSVASAAVPAAPKAPPVLTKENLTVATTVITALGSQALSGPLQYVFAGIVAVSFVIAAYMFFKNRQEAKA